eukprot:6485941-Amphidinium_carterae.1
MEGLHWCVQAQVIRRGGLRQGKKVPVGDIDGRVAQLRTAAKAEEAAKKADGGSRKTGELCEVHPTLLAWEDGRLPAFTDAERELHELCYAPHSQWLQDVDTTSSHEVWPNPQELVLSGEHLKSEVKELPETWPTSFDQNPTGIRGPASEADCSPEMSCYLHARQTLDPAKPLSEFLREAVERGAPILAKEASKLLDRAQRAGEGGPRVEISPTTWADVNVPGNGTIKFAHREMPLYDYGEQLPLSQHLRDQLQLPEDRPERRQCLLRCVAGGLLLAHTGKVPNMTEVDVAALSLREELHTQALCASHAMGSVTGRIPILEHELRTHVHDILAADHDRDYRVLAALAPAGLAKCKVVIMRVTYAKQATVEIIVGAHFDARQATSTTLYLVVHRGHMKMMPPPPEGLVHWLDFLHQTNATEIMALGSEELLQRSAAEPCVVAAPVEAACRCCRMRKWSWAHKHARLVGGSDTRQVGEVLWEGGGRAQFIVATATAVHGSWGDGEKRQSTALESVSEASANEEDLLDDDEEDDNSQSSEDMDDEVISDECGPASGGL